ncbi:MAG: DPP IV N-terminal domain-containing protein [Flavobacteriales bacterium]|nr:DPP IV N-terminal domain-containing protein [Flavobacteriales bacterium]
MLVISLLSLFLSSLPLGGVRAAGPPNLPSGTKGETNGTEQIDLEDIWKNGTFSQKSVYGLRSMNDGLHYTTKETVGTSAFIVKYKYENGEAVDTLLRSEWLVDKESGDAIPLGLYQFSDDESKIMLPTAIEKIYRHSTRETNYIWDRNTKVLSLLSAGAKQRYATFSPKASKAAFVRGNDIFIKDAVSGKETRVTEDGEFNSIINGATDWVYEEEFGFDKAFFWSPDGSKIAYYRFDESSVREFSMDVFGGLYPTQYRFKYPKAGEENAKVTIHVYDLKSGKNSKVDLGDEYEYIPRIKWTNDPAKLSIQRMNRHQNKLELLIADVNSGKVKVVLTEKRDTYIKIADDLTFLSDDKTFIWTSDKDGYNHIYHYSLAGKLIRQVTSGNWEVASYLGYDQVTNRIFYIGAESYRKGARTAGEYVMADYRVKDTELKPPIANPIVRNLYTVDLKGSDKTLLSTRSGDNRASFSKGYHFYINYHTDANAPVNVTLHQADGKKIRVLEDNKELKEKLGDYELASKEFFSLQSIDGVELNAWIIKPVDFKPQKKYPVLMLVYGGPGVQTVKDSWGGSNYFWYQMLAQKGCIIVSVENRGTPGRGADFAKCTYRELGKLETIDQMAAAKYLQGLDFIDPNRIAIWGWSYGGYMTSLCMTKGADIFKLGMAVAPVTNWRFYDSIYTERFMQTPQENPDGYDDNSPINHVDKLKGKFLLVHGSGDDNVHYQNSMEMVTALVEANKQFDLFIYPDKAHGIRGGNARLHLFTKMTDFVLSNL